VLIKMDQLPTSTDLKDRFLIQAAWKDDPAEEVQAFWKRGPKKDELFQKKFSSELFLPDETEEQKEEERAELAAEMQEESVQEVEQEAEAAEAAALAKYDTNNDGELDEAELEAAAKAEAQAKADAAAKAEADAEAEAEERYQAEQDAKREMEAEMARKQAEQDEIKAAETKAKNAAKAKAKQEKVEAERVEKEQAAAAAAAAAEAAAAEEAATRARSPSTSGPSLAMQFSLPNFGQLTSDPVTCLSDYATPLKTKLCATALKAPIEQAADAAGQPAGLVVFLAATVTLLLMIVIAGLSAVTTILGLLLPAVWSLQMLCTGLDASAATAMPLYWIIFTGLLMLEDIGLMAWVPLYWLLKPLALISLWGFQGAAILVPLVSK
jgi:hypothetical protein